MKLVIVLCVIVSVCCEKEVKKSAKRQPALFVNPGLTNNYQSGEVLNEQNLKNQHNVQVPYSIIKKFHALYYIPVPAENLTQDNIYQKKSVNKDDYHQLQQNDKVPLVYLPVPYHAPIEGNVPYSYNNHYPITVRIDNPLPYHIPYVGKNLPYVAYPVDNPYVYNVGLPRNYPVIVAKSVPNRNPELPLSLFVKNGHDETVSVKGEEYKTNAEDYPDRRNKTFKGHYDDFYNHKNTGSFESSGKVIGGYDHPKEEYYDGSYEEIEDKIGLSDRKVKSRGKVLNNKTFF